MYPVNSNSESALRLVEETTGGIRLRSGAGISYTLKNHLFNAFKEINLLRKNKGLCDVILNVGRRKFFAHRVILSAGSPYFEAMFTCMMAECLQKEVTIRGVDEEAMDLIIDFFYTSKIAVDEWNVLALLPAACLLQVGEVESMCWKFLKRDLDTSNCLGIRSLADTHFCRDMFTLADQFTRLNISEVIHSDEFLLLPLNQLIDVMSNDELNVSEEQVFNGIMFWVHHNVTERKQHLPSLLQHIRLPLANPKFCVKTMKALIKSDHESYWSLFEQARKQLFLLKSPNSVPRRPTGLGELLFAVGGWAIRGGVLNQVESYDPLFNEWIPVASMATERCGVAAVVLNNMIYAVGGDVGHRPLNTVARYHPKADMWTEDVAPVRSCRTGLGLGVLNKLIYAVGGRAGSECLNSVERYDPWEDEWSIVAPLITRRVGAAVAVLKGYLYVMGGSDGRIPLKSVEKYDPLHDTWTLVSPMSTSREYLGCAVFNNQIYAVGGRDRNGELRSTERYDPATNCWNPVADLITKRSWVNSNSESGLRRVEQTNEGAGVSYTSKYHLINAFKSLNSLRINKALCDVIIVVGRRKIFAHRVILSACSPYFQAMFSGTMLETRQNEVIIRDVEEEAMHLLVDFFYTSHITVDASNVQVVLPAACLLQVDEVQSICVEFLKTQIDISNCLGIRSFADTHFCKDLFDVADRFIRLNIPEVVQSEEFTLLPVNQFIDIIANDELNIRMEEQVLNAVMSWVNHNVTERRQHLLSLLQHVRLPLANPKFRLETMEAHSLIKSDESCWSLVAEARKQLFLSTKRSGLKISKTVPRRPVWTGEALFAVGGWAKGDVLNQVERYNPLAKEWIPVTPMTKRRYGGAVAVLNNQMYAVGGHDGHSPLNSVERYDPQTNEWSQDVAQPTLYRTGLGIGVLQEAIYAIGGEGDAGCLNRVEKYDPMEDKWSIVAPLNARRVGAAVAVLGGCLYVIGGSDGHVHLNSVEKYDPVDNTWAWVCPMLTRRKYFACAVLNNQIYAVGGRGNCMELRSAEKYDPAKNTWSPVADMITHRTGLSSAVINERLYAVGGFDGNTQLNSVECYDAEKNQWSLCEPMTQRRFGGGVAVMRLL